MSDEYRNILIAAEQRSQDAYDKTIVSLSGGALALSITFLDDIIDSSSPTLIWAVVTAWVFWALSLTSVVFSYYMSRIAHRKAIQQTDDNDYSGGVGGCAAKATLTLNILSGLLFIIGVIFFIIFSSNNIGGLRMGDKKSSIREERGNIPPPPNKPATTNKPPLTEGVIPPPPPPVKPPTVKSGK